MGCTMNVAIIDADLIGRAKHRFPNLSSMKISSYHKSVGDNVILKLNYENICDFDKVYISKVFTDTPFNCSYLDHPNVVYGGTGFYFDKAPNLPEEIEHCMPDYHLYDDWVTERISDGCSKTSLKEYTNYSIGYLTRGCFRKCGFCVNQKYNHVFKHSDLEEFYDSSRKKICLLDDNFLGYSGWKPELAKLISINKPFKFKQGLDERILTDEKCEMLFSAKYDGDFTFAFDDISDYRLIEQKLQMIRRYTNTSMIKFYILCGYKNTDVRDIVGIWARLLLLMKYQVKPFIMIYGSQNGYPIDNSEYRGLYKALSRWCNQPSMFKKKSFREFVEFDNTYFKSDCASYRSMIQFESKHPNIAKKYFDVKYEEVVN